MADAAFDPSISAGEGVPLRPEEPKFELPKLTADDVGEATYQKLSPGTRFLNPAGAERTKPFYGRDADEYLRVPEGEFFINSEGKRLQKPKYEGISMTAETLYNMARSPEAKRDALGAIYGQENVKEDYDGQPYVQDGKTRRRPGRSTVNTVLGHIAADAAPFAGATAGTALGMTAGSIVPGAGTALGGLGGAGLGTGLGIAFNDSVLAMAGVHQGSLLDQAEDIGVGMLWGAGGQAFGSAAVAAPRAIGNLAKGVSERGGRLAGKYLGIDKASPETQETAQRLIRQGVLVPPSKHMMESPYIAKVVETLDPEFRKQDVLGQSANEHYEKKSKALLEGLGVSPTEKLTAATKPVSSQAAGEAVITRYNREMAAADQKLALRLHEMKFGAAIEGKSEAEAIRIRRENLEQAATESRTAATNLAHEQFASIRADVAEMYKRADAGENARELWLRAAGKIETLPKAIRLRARDAYEAADAATGGAKPNIEPLLADAQEFMKSLPEAFQAKHPDIVKRLVGLETGEATFGQLHFLRSMLRSDVDYGDLSPSLRDGIYKRFAGKVDEVLHQGLPKVQGPVRARDPNESLPRYGREALPEGPKVDPRTLPEGLEKAARMLDQADAWYGKTMPRFRDEVFQAVVTATKAGMPPNPKALARLMLTPDNAERIEALRKTVGPTTWQGVLAADVDIMLDGAKTLIPGETDAVKFSQLVLDRVRNDIFDAAYRTTPALASKIKEAARQLSTVEGKLSIEAQPGDTVATLMKKAQTAKAEADLLAEKDPLDVMGRELKRLDTEFAAQRRNLRTSDPHFNFLEHEVSAAGAKAADKIIGDKTLLVAAGLRFGEGSPEFIALRQVAAKRLLQRSLQQTGKLAREFSDAKADNHISEEVQAAIFPGTTRALATQLAQDMEFLVGGRSGDFGGGIIASQRIMSPPLGPVPHAAARFIPGSAQISRFVQTKYYQMMTWGATNQTFLTWIYEGLRAGPVERQRVAQAVRRAWGAAGAGGAAIVNQERK